MTPMHQAPATIDPTRSVFADTLGGTPGRARLTGRKVVVVGAGQRPSPPDETVPIGNGRAIALLAAREGAAVACIDAVAAAADATVAMIDNEGGRTFAEVADVRDAAAIAPLLARCAQRLGGLDGLVLNVGISRGLPLDRITAETWDDEFAVNLRSHMLFAQAALPLMAEGGSIVLMSSLAALRNNSRNPAYETSKAAQVSLARAIAVAGEPKPEGKDAEERAKKLAERLPRERALAPYTLLVPKSRVEDALKPRAELLARKEEPEEKAPSKEAPKKEKAKKK